MLQLNTNNDLTYFRCNLDPVRDGQAYLRIAKDSEGDLIYEIERKRGGFAGLIQYIIRLFDSSYNVNNAFTLLADAFKKFKSTPELESVRHSLLVIGEHVNSKRIFRKIDLTSFKEQKTDIIAQVATTSLPSGPIAMNPRLYDTLLASHYHPLDGAKVYPPLVPRDAIPALTTLLLSKIPGSDEILRNAGAKTAEIFSYIEGAFAALPQEKVKKLVSRDTDATYTPKENKIRISLFRMIRFIYAAFKESPELTFEAMVAELYNDSKTRGGKWEKIKENFLKAQAEVFSVAPNLVNHTPTWLHGSSLSMLPGSVRMVLPEGVPSLIPSGILLKHGYTPLTGEVTFGVTKKGINRFCLSGVGPSYLSNALEYAHIPCFAFAEKRAVEDILATTSKSLIFNRLKIMLLRLLLTNTMSSHREAIASHLTSLAEAFPKIPKSDDWIKALGFLGKEEKKLGSCIHPHGPIHCGSVVFIPLLGGDPTLGIVESAGEENCLVIINPELDKAYCKTALLRKVDVNRLPKSKEESISKETAEAIEEDLLTTRENLENLIKIIQAHAPADSLLMSSPSIKMLHEHVPIVFASYTANKFEKVRSDIKGEIALRGAQEFGKDIQALFCPEEDVERVRGWLGAKLAEYRTSIHVLSFEACYYLHAQNLTSVSLNGTSCFD